MFPIYVIHFYHMVADYPPYIFMNCYLPCVVGVLSLSETYYVFPFLLETYNPIYSAIRRGFPLSGMPTNN